MLMVLIFLIYLFIYFHMTQLNNVTSVTIKSVIIITGIPEVEQFVNVKQH